MISENIYLLGFSANRGNPPSRGWAHLSSAASRTPWHDASGQIREAKKGATYVSVPCPVHGGAKRTAMRQSRRERKEEMVEQSRERPPTMGRPGLLTYAAIMMFVLGGFHILLAISEFANSTWVLSRLDVELFIPILIIWGIVDLVIGSHAVYAGVSILRGATFGFITGFTFAGLGII